MRRVLLMVSCAAQLVAGVSHAADDRVAELERRIDDLARAVDQLKGGAAADTTKLVSTNGLGPAASKVYGAPRGISIGGYGEMLYENFDRERQDGTPSGRLDRLDFLRQVLYVGHRFDDRLVLNSGVAIEHAGIRDQATVEGRADPLTGDVTAAADLSGEVLLEFAYLEWAQRREFGVRAGMLLVPLGIVNERHEPTSFFAARRPDVEQRIIPTTWSANGVGFFGEFPSGIAYRLYLTEGLDGAHFDAGGIRAGRQRGSRSLFTQPGVSARLDYSGVSGLMLGGSVYTGNCWQEFQPAANDLAPRLTLADVHGRLEWRRLRARALYAAGSLSDAGALSDALGLVGNERIGESFFGAYVEAAYEVLSPRGESRFQFAPYLRWETYDTQNDVAGGSEDPALEHTVVTAGAAFRPHPNVVVKADREWRSNPATTEIPQWNLALGYMF
jgi:hypothetical protein